MPTNSLSGLPSPATRHAGILSDTAVDIPQYTGTSHAYTYWQVPDIHAEKVPDMESGLLSSVMETESGSQGAATLYPQSPTIPLNLTQQGGPDPYPHRQWAGHLLCPSLHSWMQMGRGSSITHCSHVNLLPAWAGAPHLPFAPSGAQARHDITYYRDFGYSF